LFDVVSQLCPSLGYPFEATSTCLCGEPGASGLGEIEHAEYFPRGEAAAMVLPNRGPLRFHRDGRVHEEVLEAYS